MKKLGSVGAVIFFFFVLFRYHPAGAFNEEATLYLGQATQQTPKGEILEPEEENEADEIDDDEYDDEDEYADDEDGEPIPDPYVRIRNAYVRNRNKLIAE